MGEEEPEVRKEYLLNYYTKHGFKKVGEMYLEDNIPHVEMFIKM